MNSALFRPPAPQGPESWQELVRVERVLAIARVFLATLSLVAIYYDPTQPRLYARFVYTLLALYVVHSAVVLLVLWFGSGSAGWLGVAVHGIDILWCACITLFTEGSNSPFFVFITFVLLAAAFRWGMRETLLTGITATAVLVIEALVIGLKPGWHLMQGELEINRLIMRSIYLLILSFLLGYLANKEKQLRNESGAVARLLGKARAEIGFTAALHVLSPELFGMFGGISMLLVVYEQKSGKLYTWEQRPGSPDKDSKSRPQQVDSSLREIYLCASTCSACYSTRRRDGSVYVLALDAAGGRVRGPACPFPDSFWRALPSDSFLSVLFSFGNEWTGRLFIFGPRGGDRETQVHLLQTLARQAAPAVYNSYLLARLRSRISAVERSRFACELHDGPLQSLISVELQLKALRQQAESGTPPNERELSGMQELVHHEVLEVRDLMQHIRSLQVGSRQFSDLVAGLVNRFERETGICARLVAELDSPELPPRLARELARIVQEALVNVRKHSGAKEVIVALEVADGSWKVIVEDDGRGFDFAGRFSGAELDSLSRTPAVIRDRVRSIGGHLVIDSAPGRGARLEVTVPRKQT